jgi:imidazoleglycerol-phosphate dehydratase
MSPFSVSNLKVINEAKPGVPILTGIGFFDHMLDQFNSHAQIGVGLQVDMSSNGSGGDNAPIDNKNRWATTNQVELCETVGSALGSAMWTELNLGDRPDGAESRFCCPLDEGLVECCIRKATGEGLLVEYTLAPYGSYPKGKGRSKIGHWETFSMESFWSALAKTSKLEVSFRKIRGENGHHIVESSFKAFSRALRQYLDDPSVFASKSENDQASVALSREAKVERSTKETSISVHLLLNGSSDDTLVETGIPVLDEFFTILAQHANLTLKIKCTGDLWVDDHHSAEDVSIAVGQCLTQALGTKAGLNRMWLAKAELGDADVEVTMDLSNRPYMGHNLHETLGKAEYIDDDISETTGSPLSCEMLEHVLDSLVMNGRMTVHIVEAKAGATIKESVLATAKAFGKALRVCAMVDQRRAGQTASSKGTLSV